MNGALTPLQQAALALKQTQAELDRLQSSQREPIAIVGMACRFPGGANSPETYWRLLRDGVDAITEVPRDRWDIEAVYDENPDAPGKMYTRWGGFLERVEEFDAEFFGISPREALRMDPQQRLLLEVSWEALERAGQTAEGLAGSQTGVFVGISTNDYAVLTGGDLAAIDPYSGTGNSFSVAGGRLSYFLGVHGPNLTIDTACSSSLVTVHLACQSLRARECDLALAGGVNLTLTPDTTTYLCRLRAMAPNGRCKTFDAAADGYVRGEGCGIVALKRLSDARRDGDPVLAVIRGSAVNHDGRSNGLTAPNGAAQRAVIAAALRAGGIDPSQVGFVEAHGTGTPLGDPVELEALAAVLGGDRRNGRELLIGSVKTNLGHLEAAAGVAGLMKAVLAVQHGELPPSLHFRKPTPHVPWREWKLDVPRQVVGWSGGSTERVAGVSSFGISGTNAHVVLAGVPESPSREADTERKSTYLLPLSARRPEALRSLAAGVRERDPSTALADLCSSAALRRSHFEHRLAIVADSPEQLDERLAAYGDGGVAEGVFSGSAPLEGRPRTVFVFPGQGGQWAGMGRRLLAEEPVFRAAIEDCGRAMGPWMECDLFEVFERGEMEGIDVIQPALFALQVGLTALMRSWGVEPNAVVGHSMGEVAAACVAGALILDDAARVICRRSSLLRRIGGRGAMAIIEISIEDARTKLAGWEDRISVAVSNSSRSTVVSGDDDAVSELLARLDGEGLFCRKIKVDVASHSPQVDELREELLDVLAGIAPRAGAIPLYSTVTGGPAVGDELGASYWVRNLRRPVVFADAMKRLIADGHSVFVEIGPHPVLLPAVEDNFRDSGCDGLAVGVMRRDEPESATLLEALGALYASGQSVRWEHLYGKSGRFVSLPTYPWQRERFWAPQAKRKRATGRPDASPHPFLDLHIQPAGEPGLDLWEGEISVTDHAFLADHRLEGTVVFPGAGYVDLALTAGRTLFGEGALELSRLEFQQLLAIPEEARFALQVSARKQAEGVAGIEMSSRPVSEDGETSSWTLNAVATVRLTEEEEPVAEDPSDVAARCETRLEATDYYEGLRGQGLEYGPAFTGIVELRRQPGEALAKLQIAQAQTNGDFAIHPALLDMAFQAMGAALPGWRDIPVDPADLTTPYLPIGLASLRLFRCAGEGELTAHARLTAKDERGVEGDLWLRNAEGRLVLDVRGFRLEPLAGDESSQSPEDWLYQLEWRTQALDAESGSQEGVWLIVDSAGHVGSLLAPRLEARGAAAILVNRPPDPSRTAWRELIENAVAGRQLAGIASVWSHGERVDTWGITALVQAIDGLPQPDAPKLVLATAGCFDDEPELWQAPAWGFGRTIALEHPELRCICVDLSPHTDTAGIDGLCDEICEDSPENQIRLRGRERQVARLAPYRLPEPECADVVVAGARDFRLEIDQPGVLDRLALRAVRSQNPGPGEVAIRVEAAGLNFVDVLGALGARPDLRGGTAKLGGECAGIVTAVGEGVGDLKPGDEVVAIAQHCFATTVTTSQVFVARKPTGLSFGEAATLPIAYATAYYALHHVGRLQPGERVLIHSASGGVGLAAIQVAHWLGAEIFATAGSEEKRAFLRELGIEHVMDSRRLDFADQTLALTGGRGVDVVLNSLGGAAIERNLELLAPYGRFLEIGKKDVYANHRLGLFPFHKNLSYSLIDLARMFPERPAVCGRLLREVLDHVEAGRFAPLRHQTYDISQAADALREMAQARHIGKIVVSLAGRESARIHAPADAASTIRSDGTYLITGGLGGLGLAAAEWLGKQGARSLVLMGRGGPSESARDAIEKLRWAGVRVTVVAGDISDAADIQAVLREIDGGGPPLRGVIHAAGVLDDATVLGLDAETVHRVLAPKVDGAWNLHELTRDRDLDFFVLYSSGAGLLGSPGQAHYAAANAFLDALARYRHQLGLPALSVNWGPFADVGMVADQTSRLARGGMGSLTRAEGVALLGKLLAWDMPQIAVLPFVWRKWNRESPLLEEIRPADGASGPAKSADAELLDALSRADSEGRLRLLEERVRALLAPVLRTAPERIAPRTPFNTLGLDSLMALELRNRLEAALGLRLPATLVWKHPTLSALARHLAETIDLPAPLGEDEASKAAPVTSTAASMASDAVDRIAELSDEEVERLFAERMGVGTISRGGGG